MLTFDYCEHTNWLSIPHIRACQISGLTRTDVARILNWLDIVAPKLNLHFEGLFYIE